MAPAGPPVTSETATDAFANGNCKPSDEFLKFRRSYLTAFLCGTASDWLKGPYIYRLYEARGFAPDEITVLFAVGYMSSAVFGVLAGVMSDAFGRRRMCLSFCVLYGLHALLHAFTGFVVLMFARAISGIATALLFSAFEAWMVAEHGKRFSQHGAGAGGLAETFALQTQWNALAAVISGLVAQGVVIVGGYSAPLVAAVPLLAYCATEVTRWPENRGGEKRDLREVAHAVLSSLNPVVMLVGALQCLFEGSMHVFVFLWTPCLQRSTDAVPHGLVFSLFMVSMMLGGRMMSPTSWFQPSLGVVFLMSACCLLVPSATESLWVNLVAFCAFEGCVGCYFPQIAMLRSRHLKEESRSATMSLFRVPFNCIVVMVLLWGRALPAPAMLRCAAGALATGAAAFYTMPGDAEARVAAKVD